MRMRVEGSLILPYRCSANDFHPVNHSRQPRVLPIAVRSIAARSPLSVAASRPRKCTSVCVISLAICVLAKIREKKNQKRRHDGRARTLSPSRFVWLGLREA